MEQWEYQRKKEQRIEGRKGGRERGRVGGREGGRIHIHDVYTYTESVALKELGEVR